jgi:hypothetical protein
MSDTVKQVQPAPPTKIAASAAVVAATGALACGVCCVLPFALPAAVLATSGGIIAWFADARGWTAVLAVVVVAIAWVWVGVQSYRTKRRLSRTTIATLLGATLLMLAAFLVEPVASSLLAPLEHAEDNNGTS